MENQAEQTVGREATPLFAEQTVWVVFMCDSNRASTELLTVTGTLQLAVDFCERQKQLHVAEVYEDEEPDESYNNIEVWRLDDQPPINYDSDYDGFLIQESKFEVPPQYVLK
jgi:hypothetical protein